MSNISVDWRHISAAIAVLLVIGGFLLFRPSSQATYSEAIPAGSNATVTNDDPTAPAGEVQNSIPTQ